MQRSEVALRIKGIVAEKAKAQQGIRTDLLTKSTKSIKPINTRKEIAKQADVSEDTVRKVEVIKD